MLVRYASLLWASVESLGVAMEGLIAEDDELEVAVDVVSIAVFERFDEEVRRLEDAVEVEVEGPLSVGCVTGRKYIVCVPDQILALPNGPLSSSISFSLSTLVLAY